MKYFFFSDSHIADGTYKDDFSQDFQADMKFIDMLEVIIRKVDRIVGVGDIFELWQTTHNKIMQAHYIVYKWIRDRVNLLKGNHDFSIFAPQTMRFKTKSGKRVLVSHGFQNNKNMRRFHTRAIIYIVGKLEKWFPALDNPKDWPRLYKLLPKKYRKFFEKKRSGETSIEKDVREYVESFIGKFDIVITGHDHKQKEKEIKNKNGSILWLDCGTCQSGNFQGILFDTDTDKYILI